MFVLVMRVVYVSVCVIHLFMDMLVDVAFGQMQPDAGRHTRGAYDEAQRRALMPPDDRHRGADERGQ